MLRWGSPTLFVRTLESRISSPKFWSDKAPVEELAKPHAETLLCLLDPLSTLLSPEATMESEIGEFCGKAGRQDRLEKVSEA